VETPARRYEYLHGAVVERREEGEGRQPVAVDERPEEQAQEREVPKEWVERGKRKGMGHWHLCGH
jgi:hypothetical protein